MSDPFLLLSSVHINLGEVLGWVSAGVTVASAFVAATPTPNPKTVWGKIYKGIETAALLIGRAKDSGVPIPALTASQSTFVQAAEKMIPTVAAVAEPAIAALTAAPAPAAAPVAPAQPAAAPAA